MSVSVPVLIPFPSQHRRKEIIQTYQTPSWFSSGVVLLWKPLISAVGVPGVVASVLSTCKQEVVMPHALRLHLLSHFLLRQSFCFLCASCICILPAVQVTNLLPVYDVCPQCPKVLQPHKATWYLCKQQLFLPLFICLFVWVSHVVLLQHNCFYTRVWSVDADPSSNSSALTSHVSLRPPSRWNWCCSLCSLWFLWILIFTWATVSPGCRCLIRQL